ncbi:MAG: oligosaccharide flippase family protein [Maritimibacter sp.]|nr:oligosaccharide flippase family protein [Maritimibacter sp.]
MLKSLKEPYVVGVASRIIGQLISFVSVAVASRYLDLEIFGTYALAWAWVVIGNTFVFTGFYQALLRSKTFDRDRDTIFWLNAGVGAFGMLAIILFGLIAGGSATERGLTLLAMAPIPFLITPQAWWEAQLVREKRVRSASLYVLVAEACALLTVVIMLKLGYTLAALVVPRYVAVGVGLVLTGGLVRRLPRFGFHPEATGDAAKTAVPLWGSSIVHNFQIYGTDIILGAFANPTMVGAYRGGARISITASDLVMQPLLILTWSRFTRIEKDEDGIDALKIAWIENMAIAAAILWPLSATVALLAGPLVVTVLDETWLPAAGVVVILTTSRAILFLGGLLEPTLMTTGHGRNQFYIRLFGAGSLLLLLMVFAKHGAEPAAWAHLLSSVMVTAVGFGTMVRVLGLTVADLLRTFTPALVITGATAAVILSSATPLAGLGQVLGLTACLAAIAVAWVVLMVVFIRRGALVLPKP